MAEDILKTLGSNPSRKEILSKWDPKTTPSGKNSANESPNKIFTRRLGH